MKKYRLNQKYVRSGLIVSNYFRPQEFRFWRGFNIDIGPSMSIVNLWFPTKLKCTWIDMIYYRNSSIVMDELVKLTNQTQRIF